MVTGTEIAAQFAPTRGGVIVTALREFIALDDAIGALLRKPGGWTPQERAQHAYNVDRRKQLLEELRDAVRVAAGPQNDAQQRER